MQAKINIINLESVIMERNYNDTKHKIDILQRQLNRIDEEKPRKITKKS